jgi:23S rRNA (uridine2552-2'-O)-methyltransferase
MTGGKRQLTKRLKTGKGRSKSSAAWLRRQINDDYVEMAKEMGFRSRAAFKLTEALEKNPFIKKGMTVIDLGSAPGSWAQVATRYVSETGKVIALDILPMDPLHQVVFLQGDFHDQAVQDSLTEVLGAHDKLGVDVVLSDMAPSTTGHRETDHLRSMALSEAARDFALETLKPDGTFFAKIFRGIGDQEFFQSLRPHFTKVIYFKPKSSRAESKEVFVLATHRVL